MKTKELLARTELDALATVLVGDGKSPNFFFVSTSQGVQTVSRDFRVAYEQWRTLADGSPSLLPMLEDRKTGVIASVDRENEDGTGRLVWNDSSIPFKFRQS